MSYIFSLGIYYIYKGLSLSETVKKKDGNPVFVRPLGHDPRTPTLKVWCSTN